MAITELVQNGAKIAIGATAFISTFFSMVELTFFLSDPSYSEKRITSNALTPQVSRGLLVDMLLLTLFIFQHSLMALPEVKNVISKYGLQSSYRSIYVICTTATLQFLLKNWYCIPGINLWSLDFSSRLLWWTLIGVHFTAWILIYIGCICLDVNELIGIKQIYYSIRKLPDPNSMKSSQLQRLTSHVRHPSFTGFAVIFWATPIMSLDRLLLATMVTLYMYIAWNPDELDYSYQHSQYIRKFHELERLDS